MKIQHFLKYMHDIRLGSQISQGWLIYDEHYLCIYDNRYYLKVMLFNYPSLNLTDQIVKPTPKIKNVTVHIFIYFYQRALLIERIAVCINEYKL